MSADKQTAPPTDDERAQRCAICKGTGVVRQELDPGIWAEEPCGHGWAERALARHAEEQRRIRERFDSGAPSTFEEARLADTGGNWISYRAFEEVDRLRAEVKRLSDGARTADPSNPLPDPLRVPLTTYASGLDMVAQQEGAGPTTAALLRAAARLVRDAAEGRTFTEDERTAAERWARAYHPAIVRVHGPHAWDDLWDEAREDLTTAMLPLVREARAEQASRPAPLTEAVDRAALVRWLRGIASGEVDITAAVESIVAALLSELDRQRRSRLPREGGCADGCGAAEDAHCWNHSRWELAPKATLEAALADPATAEGAAALLDIGAFQGGKLDTDERARHAARAAKEKQKVKYPRHGCRDGHRDNCNGPDHSPIKMGETCSCPCHEP